MGQSQSAQLGHPGRVPAEEAVACQVGAMPLGPLLDGFHQYLLLVANQELGPVELRAKTGASDMVQETFLSAGRHFCDFRGSSQPELLWDRQTDRLLLSLNVGSGPVESIAFSPDGQRLVTSVTLPEAIGQVDLWDAPDRGDFPNAGQ